MKCTDRSRRCICNHFESTHAFDGPDSICAHDGCECGGFWLWTVTFRSPDGKLYVVSDIAKFVRDNEALFEFDDVQKILVPYSVKRRGLAGVYIRAEHGLENLEYKRSGKDWKGWTVAVYPKTYYSKNYEKTKSKSPGGTETKTAESF